ncbi:hypothetical protein Acsp02_70770 [Actinoplanes sp. NBRC 103695]|nr:hypothetical protein Acsp02_70770 [Actinoplanes sp. NBRC 103695]
MAYDGQMVGIDAEECGVSVPLNQHAEQVGATCSAADLVRIDGVGIDGRRGVICSHVGDPSARLSVPRKDNDCAPGADTRRVDYAGRRINDPCLEVHNTRYRN